MPTVQGDLALMNEPVAQRLLQSRIPARLAYVWGDGTPRVVPIGFHWNGRELVLGTPPDAPKVKVLADGTPVALTIDGDEMPHPVLMIRRRMFPGDTERARTRFRGASTEAHRRRPGRTMSTARA